MLKIVEARYFSTIVNLIKMTLSEYDLGIVKRPNLKIYKYIILQEHKEQNG